MSNPSFDSLMDRNITLGFDFMRAIIDHPAILDDIPDGVTLVLLSDDDPELSESNIDLGMSAAREGADVYIRHFPRSKLPT